MYEGFYNNKSLKWADYSKSSIVTEQISSF